jgi:hypothetical protein
MANNALPLLVGAGAVLYFMTKGGGGGRIHVIDSIASAKRVGDKYGLEAGSAANQMILMSFSDNSYTQLVRSAFTEVAKAVEGPVYIDVRMGALMRDAAKQASSMGMGDMQFGEAELAQLEAIGLACVCYVAPDGKSARMAAYYDPATIPAEKVDAMQASAAGTVAGLGPGLNMVFDVVEYAPSGGSGPLVTSIKGLMEPLSTRSGGVAPALTQLQDVAAAAAAAV